MSDKISDAPEYCCDGSNPNDLIITGMAGRFPNSENVDELKDRLYNLKGFFRVTEERWKHGCLDLVIKSWSIINELRKYDAEFFSSVYDDSENIDPQQRIFLEVCYEAIADSGYDPAEWRGKKVGVYCGISQYDSMDLSVASSGRKNIDIMGFNNGILSSRCSKVFGFKGPSFVIDTACSSSAMSFTCAFNDIRNGKVEAAIVGASELSLTPLVTKYYIANTVCSPDGTIYPFDERGRGIARGEAIAAIFIQKASTARRAYAKVLSSVVNASGYVPDGFYVPSMDAQMEVYKQALSNSQVNPLEVGFIEAHGTGTKVGDPIEIASIAQLYCVNRSTPLLLGTIKSNIGHTEAAAAVCGIVKAVLAFESGLIAPNENYEKPNPNCTAIVDGRIKVVTEVTPLRSSYISVSAFGFGGTNSHTILKKNIIEPVKEENRAFPELVLYSATTQEAVKHMLDYVMTTKVPKSFFTLLRPLAYTSTLTKPYRGFAILCDQPISEIELCLLRSVENKEVWFLLPGLGFEWHGVCCDLMKIAAFANSIKRTSEILEPLGIDLLKLMKSDSSHLNHQQKITPAFVVLCAVQVAFIDLLKKLEIMPNGIIGYGIGELACAYADQCFTAEQVILSAYHIGKTLESSNLAAGGMAIVEMTLSEVPKVCSDNVDVVSCDINGFVIVSGLEKSLRKLIGKLKKMDRFAVVLDTYGYAFHSTKMSPVIPAMKNALQKIVSCSFKRSKHWLNPSCPPGLWDKTGNIVVDATYFINCLTSDIHFYKALKHIPDSSVLLEMSPNPLTEFQHQCNGLNNFVHMNLMKRGENEVSHLMKTIGKLYCMGLNPKIEKLYPAPKYPVPRGTPLISSHVKWDHAISWTVPKWDREVSNFALPVNISQDDRYLLDHCLDGRSLFPATGYIVLAWKALAIKSNKSYVEMPVRLTDFKIHRAVIITAQDEKLFNVYISPSDNHFDITENESLIASGKICPLKVVKNQPLPAYQQLDATRTLDGKEFYAELRIRGYEYGPHFQGVLEADIEGTQGLIKWADNWIPYLDAHLLFFGILYDKYLKLPTGVRSIEINPQALISFLKDRNQGLSGVPVKFDRYVQRCFSPGVEIKDLRVELASQRPISVSPILEECHFTPYDENCAIPSDTKMQMIEYVSVCSVIANQIVDLAEEKLGKKLQRSVSVGVPSEILEKFITPEVQNKGHVLLKILNDIVNSESPLETNDILENYIKNIGKDVLYKTMFNEYSLRIVLEIIAENTQGRLKVVELFNGSQPVILEVNDILKRFYNCKLNCTLLHPVPESMDNDPFQQENIDIKIFEGNKNLNIAGQDVIISSFLFGNHENLLDHIKLLSSLACNGSFVLLYHREFVSSAEVVLNFLCDGNVQMQPASELEKIFMIQNLTIIAKKSDSFGCTLYLLRYNCLEKVPVSDTVVHILDGDYHLWIDQLKTAVSATNEKENSKVWIVAVDSPTNGIIGLVKSLYQEPGGDKLRCVFVFKDNLEEVPAFDLKNPFYTEVARRDVLMNVYRNGVWGSFKHTRLLAGPCEKYVEYSYLNCAQYGDLSSFNWLESAIKYQNLISGEKLAYIYYSALNFRDVMLATGKLSVGVVKDGAGEIPMCVLGLEFSGITTEGRRTMGMCVSQCLATAVVLTHVITFDVPDKWSLEEAVTVPVVYCTCYLALILRGRLQKGETILIHSGSGGTGTAAIRIALSLNCAVFVTVGTQEKREYLKTLFPQINEKNIGCSRDTSFEDMILNNTKGKGVDVILNSLAEEKLTAGTRCLAEHGRFLEIGKYDSALDNPIGMNTFLKGASFHGIFVDQVLHLNEITADIRTKVINLCQEGIRTGVVQPLDRTVFAFDEVENAFRYMATGKHVGKVVLKIRDEPPKDTIPTPLHLKVKPSLHFYKHKTYIIIGGLGGFGIELTKWLLQKGARNIIITSRYGARTSYHQLCLLRWKHRGENVKVLALDACKREEAIQLLQEGSSIGPIGGIFNSAVVLSDAFLENQTADSFEEVCAPKAKATKFLDELSRTMCPELDYFICFSSISCGKGNAGQSNYSYANSVMERICEERRRGNLHGLSIQWGIIGDVGVVHRQVGEDAMIRGVISQKIKSCLATLEQFMLLDQPVLCSYVTADTKIVKATKQDIFLQLARIFGFSNISDMKMTRTFQELGMDSMIGVEMQHILELNYDISLSIKELQNMTVNELKALVESYTVNEESKPLPIQKDKGSLIKVSLPDQLSSVAVLVPLNEKAGGTPVFIIHHSESEVMKLRSLAQFLDKPVYGLLSTMFFNLLDIQDMAISCLKKIPEGCNECHLVGFGTSGALAFEVYLQMQKTSGKFVKSFLLLNGSLNLANALTGALKAIPDNEKEILDLYHFVTQFTSSDLDTVKQEISSKPNFESRQSYVVNLLAASCTSGAGGIVEAIRIFRKVREELRNYYPQEKIPSDVTMIDATGVLLANDVSMVKAAISKVCEGKIIIHRIPGSENFLTETETVNKISHLMNDLYK